MLAVITLARLHPLGSMESGSERLLPFVALHPETEAGSDPLSLGEYKEDVRYITPVARCEEVRRDDAERLKAKAGSVAGGGVEVGKVVGRRRQETEEMMRASAEKECVASSELLTSLERSYCGTGRISI